MVVYVKWIASAVLSAFVLMDTLEWIVNVSVSTFYLFQIFVLNLVMLHIVYVMFKCVARPTYLFTQAPL